MSLSTVYHSINSSYNSPFSHSVLPVWSLSHWTFQLYITMKVSFSPDVMPSGWLGSKHQLTHLHSERQTPSRSFQYSSYGVVPKGLFTFLGFFYAMRSLVPVGHFRDLSGHLFTWLVCGSFQWRHGLLFTDCIVWDDKDKVIGFKSSYWIHLGRWSAGSPKLQLFQLSQHSHVTSCRLISSSAYFP